MLDLASEQDGRTWEQGSGPKAHSRHATQSQHWARVPLATESEEAAGAGGSVPDRGATRPPGTRAVSGCWEGLGRHLAR